MSVLYILIGISLCMAIVFLLFFAISAKRGDFDRMDLDSWKPLLDSRNTDIKGKQK